MEEDKNADTTWRNDCIFYWMGADGVFRIKSYCGNT
jgi:hypothetical protein